MKFKVGDRVKIKENFSSNKYYEIGTNKKMEKYAGKIMTIREIESNRYKMKEDIKENLGNGWYWTEDMIEEKVNFTKSDLKDGDIVTYRDNHKAVVLEKQTRLRSINKTGLMYLDDYDKELNYKTGGHKETINDIIKAERPIQYETVFERKEEILDEAEKRYLRGVIRPFKEKIDYIRKEQWSDSQQYIALVNKNGLKYSGTLPAFDKNTMYKGMKANRDYTLEELGL